MKSISGYDARTLEIAVRDHEMASGVRPHNHFHDLQCKNDFFGEYKAATRSPCQSRLGIAQKDRCVLKA